MKIQVNFWNGKESLEYEATSMREAIERAVAEDVNLSHVDLSGQRLRGCNFSDGHFPHADFSDSILDGADFTAANIRYADFRCASLLGADFRFSDMKNAQVKYAKHDRKKLKGCNGHSLFRISTELNQPQGEVK